MFSKYQINVVLFYLSILILLLNFFELTLIVWTGILLLSWQNKISLKLLCLAGVVVLIFLISVISSLYFDPSLYNMMRDSAYLLKPIFGLFLGYHITKNIGERAVFHAVNIGVLVAVIHIFILVFGYLIFGIKNLADLRYVGGYFNDYEVYILVLLLFAHHLKIQVPPKKRKIYIGILILSTVLYFSRTNILQLILLSIAMLGYLKLTQKAVKIGLFSFVIVSILYAIVWQINPKRNGQGLEAFLYKIKNAPIEPFKTKVNVRDWKEFHDNFRSFENIETIRQVSSEGLRSVLFGKGLGSTIDYGDKVYTNEDTYIRHAPALHNAYATIFLKSGIAGIFLMILFKFLMPIRKQTSNEQLIAYQRLIIGSVVFLILSNWVFMGLYLKLDNKSVFLGFVYAYYEYLSKNNPTS